MSRRAFNTSADSLFTALKRGDEKTALRLIADGAPFLQENADGDTAWHIAARAGLHGALRLMAQMDAGALNSTAAQGSAISEAAARGDVKTIEALLDIGASPDTPDVNGKTPMMRALEQQEYRALEYLARMGAHIATADMGHKNILHLAAEMNDTAALRILLPAGGALNLQTRMESAAKMTPLMAAVRAGAEEAVRILLHAGANPNIPDAQNMTPLHAAAERNDAGMIYTLVCEGHADIDRTANAGYSALHTAVIHKSAEAMRALCELGADAHLKDDEKRTPLNIAGWGGFLAGVKYLMEDVATETNEDDALQSRTQAFYDALFYDHSDVADYMLQSGKVDMNRPTRGGEYPLQAALQNGQSDMAEKIIAAGADVNVKNTQGMSPLLLCALRNLVVPASLLLQKGANPNLAPLSEPPLHAAIAGDFPFMVTLLLDHGANPMQADSMGRVAIDLARQKGRGQTMVGDIQRAQERFINMKNGSAPKPATPDA
ncbi:MAG TPA: ankyrin repeat domain-containing protein [Alphaproteobacteria bacterium]|nr:ankyrin repeat domain-containing protein [Alphaproteobacteria bacterium]